MGLSNEAKLRPSTCPHQSYLACNLLYLLHDPSWVLVKGFNLSYHNKATIFNKNAASGVAALLDPVFIASGSPQH